MELEQIQRRMAKEGIDGWLLYDFRRSNDLAISLLNVPDSAFLTRRFFYWIPQIGEPVRVVSAIEEHVLDFTKGRKEVYRSWQELHRSLKGLLKKGQKVAMEYSPMGAIPTVAKVDAGTVELVREMGVEVVSSASLLQRETSVLTQEQIALHLEAAEVVDGAVATAWNLIREKVGGVTEVDVQETILAYFKAHGCVTDGRPICAVGPHAADPHYMPDPESPHPIRSGDLVLIDLWCKKKDPLAPFADITRMGVAAAAASPRQTEIFSIVMQARDAAIELVQWRMREGKALMGWEVDEAARKVIAEAGYGDYFVHRTGHSITTEEHGPGANMDNLETQDTREVLPSTCFSIEPGIYIPGEIGVRMEVDVLIHADCRVEVTGGVQESLEIAPLQAANPRLGSYQG